MAAFGTPAGRPWQGRSGSAGFRFTLYAAVAVVVMYLDQRQHYLEQLRYLLQAAAYPIQLAVNSPPAAWRWIGQSFESRERLQAENARLRAAQRDLELRSMRYEALARENGELRGLRAALPPVADRWLAAEIVSIQLSSLRQRLLIDRGAVNGVFKAQAVLDDRGLIGQTTHVGPWSAEVILITDPEHAVPVRIERTGLRTIAVGAGDATSLALPYLPANADIKSGDLLVTSGLGGVFPGGYPVARVTQVHRDAVQPLAQVRAEPLAHVDTDSEVMLVWFRADRPMAPTPAGKSLVELKSGIPSLQPQAVPPRPQPTAPGPPAATAQPARARPPAAVPRKQPAESRATEPQATEPAAAPKAAEPKAATPQPAPATPESATPQPATPEPSKQQPPTPQPDASQAKEQP
ncbi:MAG: rod shape-determining protein MreC [Gammaproteobacteria bacterium]|nr:MAG: rod shape-determining protein MreC [Gammaproteobacteria bacterium]TLZ30827.1 MAG: rod shape-determining protein MreC [Gammaproteobacteria bacterium]TLZ47605.1 MAG: rod shape-determining protein MreC [Gammaproteobacteria bacterium]